MLLNLVSRDAAGALYGVCCLPEGDAHHWRLEQERAGRTVYEHDTAEDVRALVRAEGTDFMRWDRARREAAAAVALPAQPPLL